MVNGGNMQSKDRIFWNAAEWEAIATKLAEWRPDRMFATDLKLQPLEVQKAMRAVIAFDRQRGPSRLKASKVAPHLKDAYKRLRQRTREMMNSPSQSTIQIGTRNASGYIIWSESEWEAVASEMNRLYPGLFAGRLEGMRTFHIREAQRILPEDRHKAPAALEIPRRGLLKAWDRMAERGTPPTQQAVLSSEQVTPEADKQPDAEPKEKSPEEMSGTKIRWELQEWVALAAEMHRLNPHRKFMESKTLAGLDMEDIRTAMRVLPIARRRPIPNASTFRKGLLEAFQVLKAKQAEEKLAQVMENPSILTPPVAAEKLPDVNRFEAAVAPMIKLFAEEFGKAFVPMIGKMLQDLLENAALHQQEPAAAEQQQAAVAKVIKAIVPKLPRIGVVGPLPIQQQELKDEFKNVDFVFADSNQAGLKETLQNCDRVIGMVGKISHSTDGAVSKALGNNYSRVNGGVTSIKNQIKAWMATGVIQNVGHTEISLQ
jgi:hypothetical protein